MIATDTPLVIGPEDWLVEEEGRVTLRPSPNRDTRPPGTIIDLLVVHGISLPPGEFGGDAITRLFCNTLDPEEHPAYAGLKGVRVSAHVLINRRGTITQYVAFGERAWHAGESRHEERTACNDFSIGIELEGTDETPYEDAQYDTLAALTHALMRHYPAIRPERIVGHADIAPARKTDPGPAFDWPRFHHLLSV